MADVESNIIESNITQKIEINTMSSDELYDLKKENLSLIEQNNSLKHKIRQLTDLLEHSKDMLILAKNII